MAKRTDKTEALKVGDKVRVPYRYDRLIVRKVTPNKYADWVDVECEFESGFGWYSAPDFHFVKGWLKK